MTWVAWRQYRVELIIGLALLAALTAFLLPTGLEKLALFEDLGLATCLDAGSPGCSRQVMQFIQEYESLEAIVGWFNFAPAIVGALLAAPVVMEFEQRTYRLAWTQSITRGRWLVTKLGLALLGAAIFSVVFTLLMTWWYSPLDKVTGRFEHFSFQGAMPLAYTLFAVSLAVAAGVLSRRTIVAMVATIVGFLAVRLTVEFMLRPHYITPLEKVIALGAPAPDSKPKLAIPDGAWTVDERLVDAAGNTLTNQHLFEICPPSGVGPGIQVERTDISCLEGVFSRLLYHPADRFWTFQAIEAAIFLGITAVLLGLTVWVVRRRMS